MKKIIITFGLFLLFAQLTIAQLNGGAKIVTASQAFKTKEGTKIKEGEIDVDINIQFQIGVPFNINYNSESSINPVSNDGFSMFYRFPWDINYLYQTFSEGETSFDVSKGYFGDKILVRWEIKNNYDFIKLIKIYRRKYTIDDSENWIFLGNVSKDDNKYEDLYVDGGVLYQYKVEADGLDDRTLRLEKFITGIGFRNPTATVTGNVSFDGGTPVEDVIVTAEPDGTSTNVNKGTALQVEENSFLKIENIKNPIINQATLQAWVKPVTAFEESDNGAIRLFELNTADDKKVNVFVKYLPTLNTLRVNVGNSEFLLKEYLPEGKLDDQGDEKLIPISKFNSMFTHFTVLIEDDKTPKLYINGRPINNDFQEAIRAIKVANSNPIVYPYLSFEIKESTTKTDLGTLSESYWNNAQIGGSREILLDEVRIWNSILDEDQIRIDFKRYISGNDESLISYLRLEEKVGDKLYDFSRTGFNFHKNNGEFGKIKGSTELNTITWQTGEGNIPTRFQLGVLGITNKVGNYQITGIPYKGAGEAFVISPKLGLHQFEPGEKLVYLGEGETVVNQINFIDKSSFVFNGKVLYNSKDFFPNIPDPETENISKNEIVSGNNYNAYYVDGKSLFNMGQYWLNDEGKLEKYAPIYVGGAYIYIDGELVVDENNVPITTNEINGEFSIRVPIGRHFITVEKEGHTFRHNGRFPKFSENPKYNTQRFIQDRETPIYFIDETKVTVVGKVVGGVIEGQKTIGFGDNGLYTHNYIDEEDVPVSVVVSSKDNIGVADITIGYSTTGSPTPYTKKTFSTKKGSGEFRIEVLPLKYSLSPVDIKTKDNLDIIKNKIDLEWYSIKDTITPKFAVRAGDTLVGKDYNIEEKFIYQATPEINVIRQTSDKTVTVTEENDEGDLVKKQINTEGFGPLIYSQLETYSVTMEAYEKYENKDDYDSSDPNSIIIDYVPLIDGEFLINNPFELEGSRQLVDFDDSGTIKMYLFKAGKINSVAPYNFQMDITYVLNNEPYTPVDGSYNKNAIVLGGKSDGSRTFFTEAPDQVAFILRDPPGSQSFASIEKGTSFTISEKFNSHSSLALTDSQEIRTGAMFQYTVPFGPITRTQGINDIKTGGSKKLSSQNGKSMSKQFTFNQTISTSNDPNWVGADADLYIGNSKNIYYGAFTEITALAQQNSGSRELTNEEGEKIYINKRIDQAFSEDPTDTFFIYSQRHILDKIIPELEEFIDDIDNDPQSADYGNNKKKEKHEEQIRQWKFIIQENEKAKYDAEFNRDEVKKLIKANLETQIEEYNLYAPELDQVLSSLSSVGDIIDAVPSFIWSTIGVLMDKGIGPAAGKNFTIVKLIKDVARLASEKQIQRRETLNFIENQFEKNISLDSGVGEFTFTSEIKLIGRKEKTMKLNLDSEFKKETGLLISEMGTVVESGFNKSSEFALSYEQENSETNTVTYTIKDDDDNNFLSVDVVNAFDGNGPIFSILGGRTSCPFEDESKSLFYNDSDFNSTFQQVKTALSTKDKLAVGTSWLTDDFTSALYDILTKEGNFENLINQKAKNIALKTIHGGEEVLSVKTQQIEKPSIVVNGSKNKIGIPTQGIAEYELELSNQSIIETDVNYLLRVINNPKSAKLNIEPNGTIVQIPKGKSIKYKLFLEQGSLSDFEYEGIVIRIESLCEPSKIFSEETISAKFVPACTEVEISAPLSNFIYNKESSQNPLYINISGFNTAFDGFKKVELRYRKSTEDEWTLLQTFHTQDSYNQALLLGEKKITKIEENSSSITFPFDINSEIKLKDDKHTIEISAVSFCGSDSNPVNSNSNIITGIVDLNPPVKFGTPLPIDGVLGVGEDLKVTFNENIAFDSTVSEIKIESETNQLPVHHDVSILFEGSNNIVTINKPRIISGDFSLEFWLKNLKPNTDATIFSQDNGAALEGLNIALNGKNEMVVTLGGLNVVSGTIKSDNAFHHYTITYNNETGETIIIQDADALTPSVQNITSNLNFNSENDLIIGGNTFNGNIYDLRLWNKLFTVSQSNANKYLKFRGNERNLLGYYPMNKGRGNIAYDLAFLKHARVDASWDILPKGNSYEFSNGNYLDLDKSNALITSKMDATISFWLKTDISQEATIFSNGKGDGSEPTLTNGFSNTWALNMANNGSLSLISEGNSYRLTDTNIADNNWHHVAILFDRLGVLSTYLDGEQVSTNPMSAIGGFTATRLLLGARADIIDKDFIDRTFSGKMDEFRIWNSLRDVEQIIRDQYFEIDYQSVGLILNTRLNKPEDFTGNGPNYYTYSETSEKNIPFNALLHSKPLSYSDDGPAIKPARLKESLLIAKVINENEIIFQPKSTSWNKLENQILDLSVAQMRDAAGNIQESPITWSAYVQKNEVDWFVEGQSEVVELVKYRGEEKSFEITLINKGGATEQFSITNLPSWLQLDTSSGVLSPDSKKIITASIDKDLPANIYNELLYLETDFGYNEKMPLNLRVLEQEPNWEIDSNGFNSSSNIIGRIKVDGVFSEDIYDKIAVFHNDEVRGVANLVYEPSYRQYYTYLTIYGNIDDNNIAEILEFRIWDASKGKVLQATIDNNFSMQFQQNDIKGNLANPTLFENTNSVEQNLNLNKGWTWISFNVDDVNFNNINALTKNLDLKTNDRIITLMPKQIETYTQGFGWDGNISSTYGGLSIEKMYKLFLANKQSLKIKGIPVDIDSWNFNIAKDWNLLPFSLSSNMLLGEALANYQASTGDVIKSQNLFAIYDEYNGWLGSLIYMEEGKGYMLKSGLVQNFQYPKNHNKSSNNGLKGKMKQEVIAQEFLKYSNNMNAIVIIPEEFDELLVYDSNKVLKGISKTKLYGDKELNFITVYGDGEDELEFYLNNSSGMQPTSKKFKFKKDVVLGTFNKPIDLRNGIEGIFLYPNPFNKEISIRFDVEENQTVVLEMYSTIGQLVFKKNFKAAKGTNTITVKPKLSNGIYLLNFATKKEVLTQKIIKN